MLGQGETLFMTLDAGVTSVAGEEVHDYFAVADGKDGQRTLRVFYTPVRVVCQNTLGAGISDATTMIRLRHTATVEADYRISIEMMAQLKKAREQVKARLEHLAAMTLAEEQVAEILRQTYPQPAAPTMVQVHQDAGDFIEGFDADTRVRLEQLRERHDRAVARMRNYREAARELYTRFNDEQPRLARTGWALYNAVVESADWRGKNAPTSVATSALFGERAAEKARCFQALEELAFSRRSPFHDSAGYRAFAECYPD
jgi:hypothetical protein